MYLEQENGVFSPWLAVDGLELSLSVPL